MGIAVDARMVWSWAETLATETETIPADMVLFLGFDGTLVRAGSKLELQPAPEGTKRVTFQLAGETFDSLDVELESKITTAELEQVLGASKVLGAGRVGYRYTIANAPNVCEVAANVESGQVKRVSLKRARALSKLPAAITPQVAFALGYAPAKLQATHVEQAWLAAFEVEPAVASDRKLAHAVDFAKGVVDIELELAGKQFDAAIAAARSGGVNVPPPPKVEGDWVKFNSATEQAVGLVETAATGIAFRLGRLARDLYVAWARAQRIAYLRQSAPEYPRLVEAAKEVRSDAPAAWLALSQELRGASTLERRRQTITEWLEVAAEPDAVTSTRSSAGAFGQISRWLGTLDGMLGDIWKDVPAAGAPATPPRGPGALSVSDLVEQAAALAASGALTTLKLQGAGGRVADLAKLPELANVVTLEMRNQGVTDADIEALAASPYVSGLRLLRVEQNEIGEAGVDALAAAASKTMRGLEAVGLDLNRVQDPADQFELYDETHRERVATEAGKALEAKYGRITWLHPPE